MSKRRQKLLKQKKREERASNPVKVHKRSAEYLRPGPKEKHGQGQPQGAGYDGQPARDSSVYCVVYDQSSGNALMFYDRRHHDLHSEGRSFSSGVTRVNGGYMYDKLVDHLRLPLNLSQKGVAGYLRTSQEQVVASRFDRYRGNDLIEAALRSNASMEAARDYKPIDKLAMLVNQEAGRLLL